MTASVERQEAKAHRQSPEAAELLALTKTVPNAIAKADIRKLLETREGLFKLWKKLGTDLREESQILRAVTESKLKYVDGTWQRFLGLELVRLSAQLEQLSIVNGREFGDNAAAQHRARFRLQYASMLTSLTEEEIVKRGGVDGISRDLARKDPLGAKSMLALQTDLERYCLTAKGVAGFVSLQMRQGEGGYFAVVPTKQLDGRERGAGEIIEGGRDQSAAEVWKRYNLALNIVPGELIRNVAYTEKRPDLREQAVQLLSRNITVDHIIPQGNRNAIEEFKALQSKYQARFNSLLSSSKQSQVTELHSKIDRMFSSGPTMPERERDKENLKALGQNCSPRGARPLTADEKLAAEYLKILRQQREETKRWFEEGLAQGAFRLSETGELALRQLKLIPGDRTREFLNEIAESSTLTAAEFVGPAAGLKIVEGIATHGLRIARVSGRRQFGVRAIREVGASPIAIRGGRLLEGAFRGHTLHLGLATERYLAGDDKAFENFWSDAASMSLMLAGVRFATVRYNGGFFNYLRKHGSGFISADDSRRLIEISQVARGTTRELRLYQGVIESNPILKRLNQLGQFSAESLAMTIHGQGEAVVLRGLPVTALLSPSEWVNAFVKGSSQLAGLKLGSKMGDKVNHAASQVGRGKRQSTEAPPQLQQLKLQGVGAEVGNDPVLTGPIFMAEVPGGGGATSKLPTIVGKNGSPAQPVLIPIEGRFDGQFSYYQYGADPFQDPQVVGVLSQAGIDVAEAKRQYSLFGGKTLSLTISEAVARAGNKLELPYDFVVPQSEPLSNETLRDPIALEAKLKSSTDKMGVILRSSESREDWEDPDAGKHRSHEIESEDLNPGKPREHYLTTIVTDAQANPSLSGILQRSASPGKGTFGAIDLVPTASGYIIRVAFPSQPLNKTANDLAAPVFIYDQSENQLLPSITQSWNPGYKPDPALLEASRAVAAAAIAAGLNGYVTQYEFRLLEAKEGQKPTIALFQTRPAHGRISIDLQPPSSLTSGKVIFSALSGNVNGRFVTSGSPQILNAIDPDVYETAISGLSLEGASVTAPTIRVLSLNSEDIDLAKNLSPDSSIKRRWTMVTHYLRPATADAIKFSVARDPQSRGIISFATTPTNLIHRAWYSGEEQVALRANSIPMISLPPDRINELREAVTAAEKRGSSVVLQILSNGIYGKVEVVEISEPKKR